MKRVSASLLRAATLALFFVAMQPTFAATLTVTSNNDSGAGSLRAVVAVAGSGDLIVFGITGTITLSGVIPVAAAISINGPGADKLAISGGNTTRIFSVSSAASITGLTLRNGLANVSALRGGAIFNTGSLMLDSVALKSNVAFDGGGAIYNESASAATGQLIVRNSEISGNSISDPSGIGGGAILSTSTAGNFASVTIVNSTISGNNANANSTGMVGGGIYFASGALRIFNSTVAANRAGAAGGDIHQASVANTSLTIRNSIVSGGLIDLVNPALSDIDLFQPGGAGIASFGYNIVGNRSAGTGYAATDAANGTNPNLGVLAANGGPTFTMLPSAASPALGFVPIASCLGDAGAPLTRDQRGNLRQFSGAVACDAGATEALALIAVLSRKLHDAVPYDLPINASIPIAGAVDVEPRGIGSGHQLVFRFNGNIDLPGVASVAPVGFAAATTIGDETRVTLTGVPDNRRVTVTLTGVNGLPSPLSASLGFLVGDVTGNRAVNASDISAVKARIGQPLSNANFKFDLNATGGITGADISAVKSRSGLLLP